MQISWVLLAENVAFNEETPSKEGLAMSDALRAEARSLADRPYHFEIECEPGELSPEVPRYMASVREIPYCVAQGFTEKEARKEISSVLIDYILSMLTRGLDVPEPEIKPCDHNSNYAV